MMARLDVLNLLAFPCSATHATPGNSLFYVLQTGGNDDGGGGWEEPSSVMAAIAT